jgi:hypothetical protein
MAGVAIKLRYVLGHITEGPEAEKHFLADGPWVEGMIGDAYHRVIWAALQDLERLQAQAPA